jgi:methionyl-tRNA synthetase
MFQDFWPADIHFIGKGILRFHAVYWPAILLSAGIALPKSIFVHGYITVDGGKMSKSIGNVINPIELVKKYGVEPVRYFLLREMPSTQDGDFTYEKFEDRYTADLSRGLGNFVARVITLATKLKTQNSKLKTTAQNLKLKKEIENTEEAWKKSLDELKFNEALVAIWKLIGFCDKYIEQTKPWEKSDEQEQVINDLLLVLSNIAKMLKPFLPETSEKITKQLKIKEKSEVLFPQL